MEMRQKNKWLMFLGVFVTVVLFVVLFYGLFGIKRNASAADLSQFKAGDIMSDDTMGDYTSMSEADIQNFLTSKNSCNNTNYSYYQQLSSEHPSISWHFANGHFVCLSEERFGDGEVIGSGDTAAHIIWQAAQDYKINPKVLIVLLQKETGLITDPIPNSSDYRKATGYGCPDTAACSSKYYGFKNQVRNAAALFRTVLDGGWSKYAAYTTAYIQYSPDSSCGGSSVYIENRATAALYRYTPYQPNAGALAAGYGTAYCGAYGNRNFYNYYTDWFGSTHAVSYKAVDVPDGVYEIRSALNNNKVIDVLNGSNVSGTNVQLWEYNGSDAQKWEFTKLDDGTYKIINAVTGKTLDLNDGNTNNGSNIKIWDYNGNCAQRWKLLESGSYVTIASACSLGSVIDLTNANTTNGTNIQIYSFNGTKAQKWNLMPVEKVADGLYYIESNLNTNKVVDISGGTAYARNKTNIHLYDLNETTAQYWRITRGSDGYYTVTNPNTGKVLDVENAGTTDGTNLQLYGSNGTCAQKWRILKKNDRYTFISACSYKVIDVSGGGTTNGTNIQIYGANNTNAQKWQLVNARVFSDMENVTLVSAVGDKKVLDDAGASISNGANIQLWGSNGTNAQKWHIRYNSSDNTYKIVSSLKNNKVIDVANAGTANGANIQLWTYNGTCAQKWHIVEKDNYYTFISACSGKVLDVAEARTISGTNIQLWESNETNAQKWKISK